VRRGDLCDCGASATFVNRLNHLGHVNAAARIWLPALGFDQALRVLTLAKTMNVPFLFKRNDFTATEVRACL
jgi:hypothetical protein